MNKDPQFKGPGANECRDPQGDPIEGYWNQLLDGRFTDPKSWLAAQSGDDGEVLGQLSVLDLLYEARKDSRLTSLGSEAGTVDEQPPALTEGEEVGGRLTILGLLDAGGMGEVYLARHHTLDCEVVVKVLPQHLAGNAVAVEQFQAGIKAQAKMGGHKHIVTTMDAGTYKDRLYLVMEYVPGINLGSHVARNGPLTWRVACEYARQAALGLEHAHQQGVVHRDIKPSNLILNLQGDIKILDWGLAWLQSVEQDDPSGSAIALGTHDYVAPEQAKSAAQAEPRSDLYSLGAALYFLLTGRAPFNGHISGAAKLHAHQTEPPPSIRRNGVGVPTGVEKVVCRLLEKEPRDRFGSAGELGQQLKRVMSGAGPGRTRPELITVGILAAMLLMVAAWFWMGRNDFGSSRRSKSAIVGAPAELTWKVARKASADGQAVQSIARTVSPTQTVPELTTADGISVQGRFAQPTSWCVIRIGQGDTRTIENVELGADNFRFPRQRYAVRPGNGLQLLLFVAGSIDDDGAALDAFRTKAPRFDASVARLCWRVGDSAKGDVGEWQIAAAASEFQRIGKYLEELDQATPPGYRVFAVAVLPAAR